MKLDVLKIYLVLLISEAGIVLSLFLIFGDFEPRCSYKTVLIKKEYIFVIGVLFDDRENTNKEPANILHILVT